MLWVADLGSLAAEKTAGQVYCYNVLNMMPSFFSLLS
jgi:hypothetical protein